MLDAHTTLAWLRDEIEPLAADLQPALPAANTPLCEFLRDGRALCLLTTALPSSSSNSNQQDDKLAVALPKNLQRSLHQVTTFHALERVQYFIKWCSATAALDAYLVFSSVQLLDEQNEKVVCACLEALRTKFRPHLKSPGLWVQKSASDLLVASESSAATSINDSNIDNNQSTHDADVTISSSVEQHAAAPTPAASAAVGSAPAPTPTPASNKLNAFLSKFPSETNVLAPVAAAAVTTIAVSAVDEQVDSDTEDNAEEDGPVQTYDEDGDDDDDNHSTVPQPRAPLADAFSPRSSLSRSSIGSSVSFSFTSDPRHHESFTDEQQQMDLSFSSVLSSPPASPKPATRLRIPSIFERNTEKKSESSSAPAPVPALNRASAATREELAPRRLQIPSAFAAGSTSSPADVAPPAVETPVAATVVAEAVPEAAATPKPVSKLSIPAAFARSTSTSSASTSSERASVGTKVESTVFEPATTVASVVSNETVTTAPAATEVSTVSTEAAATPKPVSKLSIPAAFARSSSTSSSSNLSDRLSLEKSDAAPPASPSAPVLTKKPSRLKIPSVFAAGTSSSVVDAPPSPKPVAMAAVEVTASAAVEAEVVVETSSAVEAEAVTEKDEVIEVVRVATVDAPTTPTAAEARATPRSPFAAFISSTGASTPASEALSVVAPTTPTAAEARATPRSPFAAFVGKKSPMAPPLSVSRSLSESSATDAAAVPPTMNRSTSNSSTTPASKLAAFLSTVEVSNTFALPTIETAKSESEEKAAVDSDSDSKLDVEPAVKRETFSDDESDSNESLDADDDDVDERDGVAHVQFSDEIAFDDDAVHIDNVGFSVSQETTIGLPSDGPVASKEALVDAADNSDANVKSHSSEERHSSLQFDERISEDSASASQDAAALDQRFDEQLTDDEMSVEQGVARASESSSDSDAEDAGHDERVSVAGKVSVSEIPVEAERHSIEVEHHSIEHHDHADSEQPFFVVEEVSLSKPATSSKLYAFLNAVDSAQTTHRFSHTSVTSAGDDAHEAAAEKSAEPADDDHVRGGSVHSVASSRHSSARKQPDDENTTSEHSEQSPRHSAASLKLVASSSSDVILEKERLSGENLALQLKLKSAEDALAAKDSAFAALRAELEALKAQLAVAQDDAAAKAAANSSDFEARFTAVSASHREELAAVERSRDAAAQQKALADAQVQSLTLESEARASTIVALEQQNAQLVQQLQLAKDSEEAARYSAQVAFAARDGAEELIRSQQEQLAQLVG